MTAVQRCRGVWVVAAIALGAASACSSSHSGAKDSAAATLSSVLEQDRLDLDGDSVPDEIIAMRTDSSDPAATKRIELHLSRRGTRVLADSAGWAPAPDEFNGYGNLLKSRLLYIADFDRAGRLLFLFGPKSGCCAQSLTIYRVSANGPEPYFHDPELWIDRSPVPLPGKVAVLAGRKLSEGVAPPSSEFVSAVTYAPVLVYRLEEKPRLDSAATRALTREELGGFAGYDYRADVAALRRRDGSKVLWSLREHHAIP